MTSTTVRPARSTEHSRTMTVNPWTWQDRLGYAQAIVVEHPRRTLYAAGQGAIFDDGELAYPGDMAAQAQLAMHNVDTVLSAAGMSLADVVRFDVYATNLQEYFRCGHDAVASRFLDAGRMPAAGICAQVSALAIPTMLVQITVTACH